MFESIYTHVHMETHLDHMSFRKTEREREREGNRQREGERERTAHILLFKAHPHCDAIPFAQMVGLVGKLDIIMI